MTFANAMEQRAHEAQRHSPEVRTTEDLTDIWTELVERVAGRRELDDGERLRMEWDLTVALCGLERDRVRDLVYAGRAFAHEYGEADDRLYRVERAARQAFEEAEFEIEGSPPRWGDRTSGGVAATIRRLGAVVEPRIEAIAADLQERAKRARKAEAAEQQARELAEGPAAEASGDGP